MSIDKPPEPWRTFLSKLDDNAVEPVDFHCLSDFVVTLAYGLIRSTSDVDVPKFVLKTENSRLVELGQKGSDLHKRKCLKIIADSGIRRACPKSVVGVIFRTIAVSVPLFSIEADRHTKKVSVEGVKHRMVCLKWSAQLPDDGSTSVH